MTHKSKFIALATTVASVIAGASAQAQNAGHNYGDLILGFRATGGQGASSYLLADLGPASVLRDTNVNLTLANLGSALTAAFGASWFDRTDLYMGAAMAFEFDEFGPLGGGSGGLNNDSFGTVYASAKRNIVGTAGSPGSFAWSITPASTLDAATGAKTSADSFEANGAGAISTIGNGVSAIDWDNNNPISAGIQGAALGGALAGGIQSVFGAGTFGTLNGIAVEAALDLYRIQGNNDEAGTIGFGLTNMGSSTFEGTLVIDNAGQVSHLVTNVPEPTSMALLGLGVALTGFARRRKVA